MSIRYALHRSQFSGDGNTFHAVTRSRGSAGPRTVSDEISARLGGVASHQVEAVLATLRDVCEQRLERGLRINLVGIVELWPQIRGRFEGLTDRFDRSRHEITVASRTSASLCHAVNDHATVERVEPVHRQPTPITVDDFATDTQNRTLTPNGHMEVRGHYLRFNREADDEGIFLLSDTGGETRVTDIFDNVHSSLRFRAPETIPGDTCIVEVRARPKTCRTLRRGRLQQPLTIRRPTLQLRYVSESAPDASAETPH